MSTAPAYLESDSASKLLQNTASARGRARLKLSAFQILWDSWAGSMAFLGPSTASMVSM